MRRIKKTGLRWGGGERANSHKIYLRVERRRGENHLLGGKTIPGYEAREILNKLASSCELLTPRRTELLRGGRKKTW